MTATEGWQREEQGRLWAGGRIQPQGPGACLRLCWMSHPPSQGKEGAVRAG